MSEVDHKYTENIICPYCGTSVNGEDYISDDIIKGRIFCALCNKEFGFYAHIKIVWVTVKINREKESG